MTSLSLPRTRRASQGSPHRPGTLARREARWGYLFIAPWLIGFLVFTLAPMIASLLFTFTNLNLDQSEPLSFVGLENWQKLLRDGQAWESLGVTFRFAALQLPLVLLLPFSLAIALNSRHLRASGLFRILFFLPYVIPFVSGVLVWGSMLNNETGWIDEALRFVGIQEPPTGSTRPSGSTRACCSSASGASAPGSSSTSPGSGASPPSCTTRRGSMVRASGRSSGT